MVPKRLTGGSAAHLSSSRVDVAQASKQASKQSIHLSRQHLELHSSRGWHRSSKCDRWVKPKSVRLYSHMPSHGLAIHPMPAKQVLKRRRIAWAESQLVGPHFPPVVDALEMERWHWRDKGCILMRRVCLLNTNDKIRLRSPPVVVIWVPFR